MIFYFIQIDMITSIYIFFFRFPFSKLIRMFPFVIDYLFSWHRTEEIKTIYRFVNEIEKPTRFNNVRLSPSFIIIIYFFFRFLVNTIQVNFIDIDLKFSLCIFNIVPLILNKFLTEKKKKTMNFHCITCFLSRKFNS